MKLTALSASTGLTILRISTAALMLTHGYPKLLKLFGPQPIQFADPLGVGIIASLALVVFSEFFCSIALIIGFKTRLAAIAPAITMVVAAFVIHGNDPFSKQEKAILFLISYVILILCGGGKYAIKD